MKSFITKKHGAVLLCVGLIALTSTLFTNCSQNGFNVAGSTDLASSEPAVAAVVFNKAPADYINSNTVDFTYNLSGRNLSSVITKCYLDQTQQADCVSPIDLSAMADGDHTLTVAATNQNSLVLAQAQKTFRFDRKAPIVTINSAPSGTINTNSVSISFSVTDNFPGAVAYCSLDSAAFALCTSPLSLSNLAEGAHSVQIYAQDKANNKSAKQTISFTVKTVVTVPVPTVAISASPAAFSNSASASFSFAGSSSASTIASYQCSMDNSAFAACSSPQVYSSLAVGSHSFAVKAIDAAGQSSSAANFSFAVDITAPSAPVVSSNVMNPSKSSSLNLTFNSSDSSGIAKYECKLDAGSFAACVSPQAFSGLSSASHTFVVRATDKAGNVSAEGSYSIVIDSVGPILSITSTPASSTGATSASFSFTVSDSGTGVSLIECQLDAAAYAVCASPQSYSPVNAGSHTFNLRGTDKAGNSAIQSYSWTVLPPASPSPSPSPSPSSSPSVAYTDYYVDNSCANNGNGKSQTCATTAGGAGPFNSRDNAVSVLGGSMPDTRLLFKAGQTFPGGLWVNPSGTLGHPFVISSYGSGAKPLIDGQGGMYGISITDLSNITVDGLAITNATRGVWIYFRTKPTNHIIIKNCTVTNTPQFGLSYYADAGMRADGTGSEFAYNDVSGAAGNIYTIRSNSIKVHHNYIHDNVYPNGHEPYGFAAETGSFLEIYDNYISNILVTGLAIYGDSGTTDGPANGNKVYRNIITGTKFALPGGWGRSIAWQASIGDYVGFNNQIFNNILIGTDPQLEQIVIDDGAGTTGNMLYGNTIVGGQKGVWFEGSGSAGWDVKNNIVANVSGDAILASVTSGLSFSNNLLYKAAGGNLITYNGVKYTAANVKSIDANAITTDPKFVGTSVWSDLRLQSTSPALNAGANLGAAFQEAVSPSSLSWPVTIGVQGANGSAWNMGAFSK